MKRYLWRGLVLMFAAFIAAFLFLLYSEIGLRFGVYMLSEVLLKPLTVNEAQGRLAGPLTLNGIEYEDGERRLSLASLSLDWKPSALLTGTVHITALHGEGLRFEQQPKSKAPGQEALTELPPVKLPLRLVVDSATVDGIDIKLSPESAPLSIRQIALHTETQRDTLLLHSLQIDSERYSLEARGELRPLEDYDLSLDLVWELLAQDNTAWRGHGTLRGDLQKLNIRQSLSAPFDAEMELIATELLNELAWEGTLSVPRLASSKLPYSISPAFTLGVELEANGGMNTFTATGSFTGELEQLGVIEGSLKAGYADQRLELGRLEIIRPKSSSRLEASGDIELTDPLHYRLQAEWEALGLPLDEQRFVSESGHLELTGDAQQYRLAGDFMLGGVSIPKGMWRIEGAGDRESFTLSALEGRLLDGTVSGRASIELTPQLSWRGNINGENLNPAVTWSQWPGQLSFAATINGELAKHGPAVALKVSSLTGSLRGRPVQGSAEGGWRDGIASLEQVELRVGSARLQAQGTLGEELMITGSLDAPELHDLLPQAGGRLRAEASASGPRAAPRISLRLDGDELSVGDTLAESLQAEVELDLQDRTPSHALLQLEKLQLPGFSPQSVTLDARGPLKAHRITLHSRTDEQRLYLEADAGYEDENWSGTLSTLRIENGDLGQWNLVEPAAFSLLPGTAALDELCLNRGEAMLCLGTQWGQGALTANLRSTRFPLALLAPYFPRHLFLEGELDATAGLNLPLKGQPVIEAQVSVGQGQLGIDDPQGQKLSLPFQGVALHLDSTAGEDLQGELTLSLSETDKIVLTLQTSLARGLPDDLMRHPLTARLLLSLHDPGLFSNLLPEVQNMQGSINADVQLTGSLATPRLDGQAQLLEGRLDIPRLGLSITRIALSATGDNTRQMDIRGKARSGDGGLSIEGSLRPDDTGEWLLTLAMVGENFEVARIPEARVRVSPDLTLRIAGREIDLNGNLAIPYARLEPRDLSLAVRPSKDVVIVGRAEPETGSEQWLIHTQVRVTSEDSIRFIGYGFDGRIGGELQLVDEPGSVTKGRGELQAVPGSTYSSFGRELTIEQGRANFADSPLDNPNLDIRASRTIGDVTAGVQVSGTARNPTLVLYSEPPMDQADILSYLTLGHPVSSASQSEGEALAGAAGSAGLVGGNYLAGYLGRQFGLEEVRVETAEDSQSPWVVAGKYLSPRLYVRYGVGVYEDAYSVLVRYQLSEHWQVQGEGGLHSGGDIIYTFERP